MDIQTETKKSKLQSKRQGKKLKKKLSQIWAEDGSKHEIGQVILMLKMTMDTMRVVELEIEDGPSGGKQDFFFLCLNQPSCE
eukprot:10360905-Ditylum_brightwellii.AAC.1